MSLGKRPELAAPPEIYYNEEEAEKYTKNSRMIEIQDEMSERAIELLELDDDETVSSLVLDIGCGSGLSGAALDENGHTWIGMDISSSMLNVAREREVSGDLLLCDMGQGLPFRPGSFDAAISISALQWLCNADKSTHKPIKRLYTFFTTLYAALNTGGRAVLQFYPSDQHQTDLITGQAKRAGFVGGLVIDYPNSTKAKKYYLVLQAGGPSGGGFALPKPLMSTAGERESTVSYTQGSERRPRKGRRKDKNIKEWIQDKKERRRRQEKETRADSKYSGRKRSSKF